MTKGKIDVVVGAGGGCGKLCVERLLEQGGLVRAVGRVSVSRSIIRINHPTASGAPSPSLLDLHNLVNRTMVVNTIGCGIACERFMVMRRSWSPAHQFSSEPMTVHFGRTLKS